MEKYFDNYFDMVYFINKPERVDRFDNVMNMFNLLNIEKYKRITPIDINEIELNVDNPLSTSSQSCKLAHIECLKDAVANNYTRICVFEDDFCLNQDDKDIAKNLTNHLEFCFNFMENNEWDLFYFDNVIGMVRDEKRITKKIMRYNNLPIIKSIGGKRFAHSYAVSGTMISRLIAAHELNLNHRNDLVLNDILSPKKYVYLKGIFDQLLNDQSDNAWSLIFIKKSQQKPIVTETPPTMEGTPITENPV